MTDKYKQLTLRFPLKPIESDTDLDRALEISAELMDRENDLDVDEKRYLQAVLELIQLYEDSTYTDIEDPPSTAHEMISYLLEANNMGASELANILMTDAQSAGDIIEGTKPLADDQISILSARFNVKPSLFARPEPGPQA